MEVTEKPAKKINIFDLIDDVGNSKRGIFHESEENQKIYNIFMVNLMLSQHIDCILTINKLNTRPGISKKLHHDYLFHVLPKRKRFAKLAKPEVVEKIEIIKQFYGYSDEKATEIADLITDDRIEEIKKLMSKGGIEERRGRK